ncbi:MAG: putative sugar nucleotidyl transferase, partial [Patescibacteria group bacterium]
MGLFSKKKKYQIEPTFLCVFEDDTVSSFEPLHYFHPIWELLHGATPRYHRFALSFSTLTATVACREDIATIVELEDTTPMNVFEPGDYLFVNARVAHPERLAEIVELPGNATFYMQDSVIVAARIKLTEQHTGNIFEYLKETRGSIPNDEISIKLYSHIWELMQDNGGALQRDAAIFPLGKQEGTLYSTTVMMNPKHIFMAPGSVAEPGVVLDASNGPIVIDHDVTIMANSVLKGPIYVGHDTVIKAGATIYGGTTIGHTCKVGGEVEDSVMLPYSNKQHHGFLGHSYIGSWCNLGAGTTTSDLKNTYSPIKVQLNEACIDTHSLFIGTLMGDHVKTGINSMLNSGTILGPISNV